MSSTNGRRAFLRHGLGLAVGAAALGISETALALPLRPVRRLVLDNLHTGERLDVAYWENGGYAPAALAAVNHVLRDHRNGETHVIAPQLLDLLSGLSARVQAEPKFEVISGYRSPASNAVLHEHSDQVACGSLHMQGMAIDIRLAQTDLIHVRNAAESLGLGGVGYYPTSDFIHVDVGRVRRWVGA